MNLENSKTKENLLRAFIGEVSASARYSLYSKAAYKEGYVQISNIFSETSKNEEMHAKQFLKHLQGLEVKNIETSTPTELSDTKSNLKLASETETEEAESTYPNYAIIALNEGFQEIGSLFNKIASIEKHHAARYKTLLKSIEEETIFEKDYDINWKCLKCGYIHFDTTPPKICPVCSHETGYFEMLCDNF